MSNPKDHEISNPKDHEMSNPKDQKKSENDYIISWLDVIKSFKSETKTDQTAGHLVICFALLCRGLELDIKETIHLFLFMHVRSLISSAIRLGVIGPYRGQELLLEYQAQVERLVESCMQLAESSMNINSLSKTSTNDTFNLDNIYMLGWATNPLLDILQGGHDRLYSRLFNS